MDPGLPAAPHNTEASQYFDITKAALNLVPILDENPSVSTVQALSLMGIYQVLIVPFLESGHVLTDYSCFTGNGR